MSQKRPGKFMTSLISVIVLCLLLISWGCSGSSNDGGSGGNIYAGKLVNADLIKEFTAQQVAQAIESGFSNIPGIDVSEMIATSNAVEAYSIEYYTTNINGGLIIVSGLVAFPSPADSEYPVVQYHHGTQFNNQDVPSNPDRSKEALGCMAVFAGHGYITSMPDYIGQGKSKVKHPYLHVESEAASGADMLKAVKELCDVFGVRDNSKLFILGLSQGGHATMALQKHLETADSEQPFNLTASVPIAGVYDVPKEWDFLFTNPPGCSPLAAHLTLAYRYIYGFKDTLSELFLPPYDSQILSIDDGTHNGEEMYEMLPKTMEGLLQPNFIDEVNAKTHPFYEAMKDNIIDNFAAITPTRLYTGKDDELWPYSYSVDSCNKMKALGAADIEVVDVGSGYSHVESFVPSVIRAKFWFDTF
jgi:alpha-beta hydrolase superfamily lysophospholipase